MESNNTIYNYDDVTTAWVLTDDESSRAWMDEELALHRLQQAQVRPGAYRFIDTSEVVVNQQLSKTDSESSYQRKFGKKRRPSFNGRRTKNKNKTIDHGAPSINYENDDDNNTISTLSSASLLLDDRDAVASSPSLPDESSRHDYCILHHDENNAGDELDQIVHHMLYKCNITVVEAPPPLKIEKVSLSKRTLSNKHVSSASSVTTNATYESSMLAPPKIRKNRKAVSKAKATTSKKKRSKKSVTFHKYDTVVYTSNKMEYVYSLHHDEVEREKQEYDVVDELENVVSDVGYFFQCLQQSISEGVSSKFERTKTKKNR